MSVIIKGLEMPKNCTECPFLYDRDACYAMNKPNGMFLPLVCNGSTNEYPINKFPFEEKRVDWCPLVDEEPVMRGKWIFNTSDAFEAMFGKPKCSECGFESADGGNYCPNCGARMDEDE